MGHAGASRSRRLAPSKRPPLSAASTPTRGSARSSIGTISEREQQQQQQQQQQRPEMAASFLQFCATCEKQIFTPCNSILYCSEVCRRKDSAKPVSLSAAGIMTTTPPGSAPSSPQPAFPSRIPTGASYGSGSSSSRIPTDLHNALSDLDPTEWKPKLHRRGTSSSSEAFRYLSRFHQPSTNEDEMAIERVQRPILHRRHHRSTTSIASLNTIHTPSLAQSPTTTTASSLSTSAGYTNLTYDFNTRPLPPRHDPAYSSSASAAKSIDLVMPHAAPPATPAMAGSAPDHMHFHGGVWERQTIRKLPGSWAGNQAKEGLGALFGEKKK